jgi:hypothetical protein
MSSVRREGATVTVTFLLRQRCVVCGNAQHGFMVRSIRVNKCSLRSTDVGGIGALMDPCVECGTRNGRDGFVYVGLHPKDEARVDAYRQRRWAS